MDKHKKPYLIMKVKDLINCAFGELEGNAVNFKLVQTLLYLIARQLNILERNVEVSFPVPHVAPSETFKVTEVKIHAAKVSPEETTSKSNSVDASIRPSVNASVRSSVDASITPSVNALVRNSEKKLVKKSVEPINSEEYVDMREKELRVIHQLHRCTRRKERADSHEQPDESPKPMIPVEETRVEKIFVVERVSNVQLSKEDDAVPEIAIVTQKEFMELTRIVEELVEELKPVGSAQFPSNQKLMEDLRKDASLSDAMAALQLSARLEATEKVLGRMVEIVTDVVSTSGKAIEAKLSDKGAKGKKGKEKKEPIKIKDPMADVITTKDLEAALEKLANGVTIQVNDISSDVIKTANMAYRLAASVETRIASSEDVGPRVASLEQLISVYSDQINALDAFISTQVTIYQEQLTQMQHELEVGLEAMNEALANAQGGDTLAVAELNDNFINLQLDQETMAQRQKNLQRIQEELAIDLKEVWKHIEMLKETKSDRDEVADALRDKAGIKDLNGIVAVEQFDAVRGDLEKQILAAYEKFNNQEIVWQKAIDEVLRELSEKADETEVSSLEDSIEKVITDMKIRINIIASIVGQPRAAALKKKIFRDGPCVCCNTPGMMETEEPRKPPALPKSTLKQKTEEISEPKGDGDHKICYPGLPIPHPPDPRSHICRRYCGGSHTMVSNLPQASADPVRRPEEKQVMKKPVPCQPCQPKPNTREPVWIKPDKPETVQDYKPMIHAIPESALEATTEESPQPKEETKPDSSNMAAIHLRSSLNTQRKTDIENKSVKIEDKKTKSLY